MIGPEDKLKRTMRLLNIGAGPIAAPREYKGWDIITLDIDESTYPDLCMDARDLTTLKAGQYDAVYASHVLEHFSECDVERVLWGFYHVLAPDYPGFGNSDQPPMTEFEYSFDNLASLIEAFVDRLGIDSYSLYLMDYGAPIGFRLAAKHPEQVDSLIIQNGNAYVEGIDNDFWAPIKEYWKDRAAVNQGLDNDWWRNVTAGFKNPKHVMEMAVINNWNPGYWEEQGYNWFSGS